MRSPHQPSRHQSASHTFSGKWSVARRYEHASEMWRLSRFSTRLEIAMDIVGVVAAAGAGAAQVRGPPRDFSAAMLMVDPPSLS